DGQLGNTGAPASFDAAALVERDRLVPGSTRSSLCAFPRQHVTLPQLANQQVHLTHIETRLAIVLPSQLEKGESILVGSKATVHRLVQIDEAALDHEKDQRWFW